MLLDRLALVPAEADEREAAPPWASPAWCPSATATSAASPPLPGHTRARVPGWTTPGCGSSPRHPAERAFLRHIRDRVGTLIGLLKGEHGLEDHGARSWWGLLTRINGLLAAYIPARFCDTFRLA